MVATGLPPGVRRFIKFLPLIFKAREALEVGSGREISRMNALPGGAIGSLQVGMTFASSLRRRNVATILSIQCTSIFMSLKMAQVRQRAGMWSGETPLKMVPGRVRWKLPAHSARMSFFTCGRCSTALDGNFHSQTDTRAHTHTDTQMILTTLKIELPILLPANSGFIWEEQEQRISSQRKTLGKSNNKPNRERLF